MKLTTTEFLKNVSNPAFQAELLENPHQALQKTGIQLPSDVQIKVVRHGKDCINIVMPPSAEQTMLSDDELMQIAAGEGILAVATIVAGVTLGALTITALGLTVAGTAGAFS